MKLRTFYADTAREALQLVRAHLGEDALIVSNRKVGARIEIMAAASAEFERVHGASAPSRYEPAGQDGPASEPSAIPAEPRAALSPASPADWPVPPVPQREERSPTTADADPALPGDDDRFALVHEVRMLRTLLEGQLTALAWGELGRQDATRLEVARQMLRTGFGLKLAQDYARALPAGLELNAALRLAKSLLQKDVPLVPEAEGLVERGGVYALVGPTGVGKTTTVAKIAAEGARRFGAAQVALVTTDTYRIGAIDQLRIYGRILDVPVAAIRDEGDLRQTLADLSARRLVLIDTIGMSQRDQRLAEQVAMLAGAGRAVRRVLLIAAVAQSGVLEDVVRIYRGAGLEGCILTKVDEAPSLGGALDVLMRFRLPLHYITNGQRVPEDLHRPSPLYLVERAFRLAGGAAAAAMDAEPGADDDLLIAAARG